jgi:hypothetical protein
MDSLYSALLDETETEVRSQVFMNMPVANRLWKNREPGSGGDDIHRWPVSAGMNQYAKMIQSDADTVQWGSTQTATTAWFDSFALFAVPVQDSLIRQAKLRGKAAIINLVELETKQAANTMKRMFSSQTFGDGTVPGTLIGLSGILPSTGVGSNTVYNIPEVTNKFWRNQYFTSVGSWPVHGLFGSTDDIITQAYLSCSDNGADTPDLFISDVTVAMAYARAEGRTRQTTSRAELANIGRGAMGPEGSPGEWLPIYNASFLWDVQCPTGYGYFVHTEDFKLIEDPSFNMRWLGPLQIGNQPFLTGRVLTYRCQSEVYRRNWNAVLTGILP